MTPILSLALCLGTLWGQWVECPPQGRLERDNAMIAKLATCDEVVADSGRFAACMKEFEGEFGK